MKNLLILGAALVVGACTSPAPKVPIAAPVLNPAEREQAAAVTQIRKTLNDPASFALDTVVADGTLSRGDTAHWSGRDGRTGRAYDGADSTTVAAHRYQVSYRAKNAFGALVQNETTALVYTTGRVSLL